MSESQPDPFGESANIDREAYNEAAEKYSRWIREAIESNDKHLLEGLVKKYATRLGEYGKALECYSRTLKMDPNYIVGYARAAILIEAYALFSPTPAIDNTNNHLSKGGRLKCFLIEQYPNDFLTKLIPSCG